MPRERDGLWEMLCGADALKSVGGSQPQAVDTWGVWVSPGVPQPSWWLSGDTWGLDAQQTAAVNIHVRVPAPNPP